LPRSRSVGSFSKLKFAPQATVDDAAASALADAGDTPGDNVTFDLFESDIAGRLVGLDPLRSGFVEDDNRRRRSGSLQWARFWMPRRRRGGNSVTVAHSRLIRPAEFRAIDGVFRLH